jgi:hypothetical protein
LFSRLDRGPEGSRGQSGPDPRNATLRRGLTFCGYRRVNGLQARFPELRIGIFILLHLRIPDDADQRSGMMPITIPF